MDSAARTRISKFLSYVLRHHPAELGLELDAAGWVDVSVLLAAAAAHGQPISLEQLVEVVRENDKQRFALSPDRTRIRANQGHSVEVALGLEPQLPPEVLFHGTVERFITAIRAEGLTKRKRHHVHLSPDEATATRVGGRRGRPVLLRVQAQRMHHAGFEFFRSDNGVWLTDHVPADYIAFPILR